MDGHAPPDELVVVQNGVGSRGFDARQAHGPVFDMRSIRGLLARTTKAGAKAQFFCYSGVFSVHGLKNGIESALNLDLAKTALDRARRDYGLNGLACDERDFMYGDALPG